MTLIFHNFIFLHFIQIITSISSLKKLSGIKQTTKSISIHFHKIVKTRILSYFIKFHNSILKPNFILLNVSTLQILNIFVSAEHLYQPTEQILIYHFCDTRNR
jgi:hypothetical protein